MAKPTKRENFEMVLGLIDGLEGTEDLVDFLAHEIELVDKRANAPRKPTAAQIANEGLKDEIVAGLEDAGEGRTATEIAVSMGVSVQKASQLLRQLVAEGRVTRTEGKGSTKTVFSV